MTEDEIYILDRLYVAYGVGSDTINNGKEGHKKRFAAIFNEFAGSNYGDDFIADYLVKRRKASLLPTLGSAKISV